MFLGPSRLVPKKKRKQGKIHGNEVQVRTLKASAVCGPKLYNRLTPSPVPILIIFFTACFIIILKLLIKFLAYPFTFWWVMFVIALSARRSSVSSQFQLNSYLKEKMLFIYFNTASKFMHSWTIACTSHNTTIMVSLETIQKVPTFRGRLTPLAQFYL
jgi:hypothetical protein